MFSQRPWMKKTCIEVTTMGHSIAYLGHPGSGLKFWERPHSADACRSLELQTKICAQQQRWSRFFHWAPPQSFECNDVVSSGCGTPYSRQKWCRTFAYDAHSSCGTQKLEDTDHLLLRHGTWTRKKCSIEGEAFVCFRLSVDVTRPMAQPVPSATIPPRLFTSIVDLSRALLFAPFSFASPKKTQLADVKNEERTVHALFALRTREQQIGTGQHKSLKKSLRPTILKLYVRFSRQTMAHAVRVDQKSFSNRASAS